MKRALTPPSHVKIDDPYLNIEETKQSAVGTSPEGTQTYLVRMVRQPVGIRPQVMSPLMGNLQRGSTMMEMH